MTTDQEIITSKEIRVALDAQIQEIKEMPASAEGTLALRRVQEGVMWLGMNLKRLNDGKTCYPESYNPQNTIVEPTSDGLKL